MADETRNVEEMRRLRETVQSLVKKGAGGLSQTELHNAGFLWPDWQVGGFYAARQLVRYEGRMYFVLADVSMAKDGDYPDKDTEHYKLMSEPDSEGVFPWSQPLGDSDAYGAGDFVTLQGVKYVSLVDGNKSIPGYGDGAKYWAKS